MRKFSKIAVTLVSIAACYGMPAAALTASQSVQKEVKTTRPDGTIVTEYQDTTLITPGEIVLYRLDFENDGDEAVSDLVLTMPVPDVISYIEGSADTEGAVVVYSTDNQKTFEPRSQLRVIVGGESKVATSEDITHIRWTLNYTVRPGASGDLTFRGTLK